MYSRIHNIRNLKNVDILFLGSSHAYRGFDPRIFSGYGLRTFNLGSSAQSHLQTEVLLRRHLGEINPKLVIYEVYPGTFSSDGVEASLDIIANDKNDLESIRMAWTQNHIKVYNALIYGFYRDIFRKNVDYKEAEVKGYDKYIKGGFVEREIMFYEPDEYSTSNWNLDSQQYAYFENNLLYLRERKIPVILVQAPITKVMYSSFLNNKEFDKKMKAHGDYYNFNEILELDDSLHFYNSHHLNQNGVEIFNTKLIEILLVDYEWLFE